MVVVSSMSVIAIHAVSSDNIELPETETTATEVAEAVEAESEKTEAEQAEPVETELTSVTETDVDFYRGLISAEKVEKMNAFAKANAISLDYTPKFEQNGMLILAPGLPARYYYVGGLLLSIWQDHKSGKTYRLVYPEEPNSVPVEDIMDNCSGYYCLEGDWTLTYRDSYYGCCNFLELYVRNNFSEAEREEWNYIRDHLRYTATDQPEPIALTMIKYFEITKEQYEEARLGWLDWEKEQSFIDVDSPYWQHWANTEIYEQTIRDTDVDLLYTFDIDLIKDYYLRDQEGIVFEYDVDEYWNAWRDK